MADVQHTTSLVVAGIEILQDANGRYNLNALHQASEQVDNSAKKPGEWLKRKSTKELISELKPQVVNSPLEVVHGGDRQGTYAHELLAVSYAGWISPAFQLKVNQAFIDMRTGRSLPQVKDPAIQMIIDMAVNLDVTRQLAQAAEIRAVRAEAKADMALDDANRMTIEEFISRNGLLRQFPEHTWASAAGWLSKFCLEWNLKITKDADTPWKSWPRENRYPMQALMAWVRATTRKRGQIRLEGIEEDGVSYGL